MTASNTKVLVQLEPVFHLRDYTRTADVEGKTAEVALARLVSAGFVRPLGGKTGIYFNLVRAPNWKDHLAPAIAAAVPSGVICGTMPIYRAGWTSQRPKVLEVAVVRNGTGSRLNIEGVDLYLRSERWRHSVSRFGSDRDMLPSLKPAWALADALLDPKLRALAPDDLDFPSSGHVGIRQDFIRALKHLAPARGYSSLQVPAEEDLESCYASAYEAVRSENRPDEDQGLVL